MAKSDDVSIIHDDSNNECNVNLLYGVYTQKSR